MPFGAIGPEYTELVFYKDSLGKGPWRLWSLATPPVCRERRWRWLMYLLSGVVRGVVVLMIIACIVAGFIVRDHGLLAGANENSGSTDTFLRVISLGTIFFNLTVFCLATWSDFAVFITAPKLLPRRTFNQDRMYLGEVDPSFWSMPVCARCKAHILLNRIAMTLSFALAVLFTIPQATWPLDKCSFASRLTDFILTPFPDDADTGLQSLVATPEHCNQSYIMPQNSALGWIFWLQWSACFTSLLTVNLWTSWVFIVYSMFGFARFVLGSIILGIAARYIDGINRFSRGEEVGYNMLPLDVRHQASILFSLLTTNGLASGIFALAGGFYSLLVCWRRTQFRMVIDLVVIASIALLLIGSFTSNFVLVKMRTFFCNYSTLTPSLDESAVEFVERMCQSIKFHYRMNYHYWVNFGAALIAVVQFVFGLCILMVQKFSPVEWRLAVHMNIIDLKRRKALRKASTPHPSAESIWPWMSFRSKLSIKK